MLVKPEEISLYEEKGRILFWSYSFKVFQGRIEACFSPHKQVIPFSDVESLELVEKIP